MPELKQLIIKIEELRKHLHFLLEQKEDLLDPEIITMSRKLDILLNEYEKLISKDDKNKKEP